MDYITRSSCRICGNHQLTNLFDVGDHYINAFPASIEEGKKLPIVPIGLDYCRNCGLVQARNTAPQELLYSRKYWYRSGVTDTMRAALRNITEAIESRIPLYSDDVVLDIGSNDGTLLRSYSHPCYKVGVEPADNLQEEGAKGLDILIHDFWSKDYFQGINQAKVITAIGMFYDLDDPNDFIAAVYDALAPNGLFVAQLMCLHGMLKLKDIGNFAHEHLEFYSLRSLHHILGKHGLEITSIEENAVNGCSYRLYIHRIEDHFPKESSVERFSVEESYLDDLSTYTRFWDAIQKNKHDVVSMIEEASAEEKSIWVYGASTKGNTLLQFYDVGELMDGAAERSPEKYGRYTVGSWIRIHPEEDARRWADCFFVLPYAFIDEFVQREANWLRGGGKFIVPLPCPRTIP